MTPSNSAPLLAARQACKEYRSRFGAKVQAIEDFTWEIRRGEYALVQGPSGSGKSTLLAMLGALDTPSRGEILFEGRGLRECSEVELARVRRRMGFVFQNFALVDGLTAWENVSYPLVPRGVPRAERWNIAASLLDRLALRDLAFRRPDELSGGEQQRVAVARALAGAPDVLLADEPTSNLDPTAAELVLALFAERRAAGAAVIVASHAAEFVSQATSIVRLAGGRLAPHGG